MTCVNSPVLDVCGAGGGCNVVRFVVELSFSIPIAVHTPEEDEEAEGACQPRAWPRW